MSAELLDLLEREPAAGIPAAADLREQRAKREGPGRWWYLGPWVVCDVATCNCAGGGEWPHEPNCSVEPVVNVGNDECGRHIAAEANPAHALAAVARWRGVVERHRRIDDFAYTYCGRCQPSGDDDSWPCDDLRETAAEAKAYLGGTP